MKGNLRKKKEEEILSHLQNEQPGFSIIDFFSSTLSLTLALSRISFAPMLRHFTFSHITSPPFSPRFSRRWATPRVSTQTWTPWAQTRSRTAREKARRRHTRAITPHTPRTVQTHWRWAEKPGPDQFRVKSMFQVDVSAEGNLILSN